MPCDPTYRHHWLEVLRDDRYAIVRAASQASKATDWLLNRLPGSVADTEADEDMSTETALKAARRPPDALPPLAPPRTLPGHFP